ncbi:MAG: hypothetical protein ACR2HR_17550 [Euzebya sp.]
MLLAHPLTETGQLGVAPAFVALLAVVITIGGGWMLSKRGVRPPEAAQPGIGQPGIGQPGVARQVLGWSAWTIIGRIVGVGLLALGVVAGRFGDTAQLDNIAPALIVGFGWPALLVGSAAVGGVWAWLAPFDTLARGMDAVAGQTRVRTAPPWLEWISVAGALGWAWWLANFLPGLEPRAVGLALGLYTLVTLAGCLMCGRVAWLHHAEVFTLVFSSLSEARTRLLTTTSTAHVSALAVLIGGLTFSELRFSRWYLSEVERFGVLAFSEPPAVIGFVVVVGIALLVIHGVLRWAVRLQSGATVLTLLPWLVAGLGLFASVERDRLWTSAQLVIIRASDPMGWGTNLFGTAQLALSGWPYGDTWRAVAQITVLVVPVLAGLRVALGGASRRRPEPVMVLAVVWVLFPVLSAASL